MRDADVRNNLRIIVLAYVMKNGIQKNNLSW